MNLAFSGIAWEPEDGDAAARILVDAGISAVDIAPGKHCADLASPTMAEADAIAGFWSRRGLRLTGMQSLFFGVRGLNIFGSEDSRAEMAARLERLAILGARTGATRLVFGSPACRDRGALDDLTAAEIAVPWFRDAAARIHAHGAVLCLEPNPVRYGCTYLTTTEETAALVRAVAHPGLKLHLDTGTMSVNGEDPREIIGRHGGLIGHVHASQPDLLPFDRHDPMHRRTAEVLSVLRPDLTVSVEMRPAGLAAIAAAAAAAMAVYGPAEP